MVISVLGALSHGSDTLGSKSDLYILLGLFTSLAGVTYRRIFPYQVDTLLTSHASKVVAHLHVFVYFWTSWRPFAVLKDAFVL
jgi:hypothetical protein